MNRTLAVLLLTLSPLVPAAALDQVFLEPAIPPSSALKAQGGASTANASGFDALFVNPAAYADPQAQLVLLSVDTTAHLPLSALSSILEARNSWTNLNLLQSGNPLTTLANDLVTRYGLGAEASLTSGWVGQNLGLGFALQTRSMVKGLSLLGADTTADLTLQGVVGMAWPFDVGLGTLRLGGALRPMQKTFTTVSMTELLSNLSDLSAYTVSSGFGLGYDLGLRWDYAGFRTAFVVRDLGSTVFNFRQYSASSWVKGLGFPSGGSSTGSTLYRVPSVIAVGTSWIPDMGSLASLVQPSFSADLQIPIKDEFTQPSFWTWTHLGAEARFLNFLAVRAGLNQGYATFGLGAKLLFVDFNLSIYAEELGRYSGLNRRSALALQWALTL